MLFSCNTIWEALLRPRRIICLGLTYTSHRVAKRKPKSAKDEVTFDKIKESLIKREPEEQIKIKTADNNELKMRI